MKNLLNFTFLSVIILFSSCENNTDNGMNLPEEEIPENKYEISFYGSQGIAENNYKIIYNIDGIETTDYFNGVSSVSGNKVVTINEEITIRIEMTEGLNYIKDFNIKFKNLKKNEIIYEGEQNQPIFTVDALTHKETLESVFNYSVSINSFNFYKMSFKPLDTGIGYTVSPLRRFIYDFNKDIGIQQNTRHTLKIEVDNQSVHSYFLDLGPAWGDFVGANSNGYNSSDQQFWNDWSFGGGSNTYSDQIYNNDNVFHFVIPEHITELKVGLGTYSTNSKASAKISLMRINGTVESEEILVENSFTYFTWNLN